MLVEILCACSLLTAADAAPPAEVESGWLATVRHYTRGPGPQWTIRLREIGVGHVSASLWWVEGDIPQEMRRPPTHLAHERHVASRRDPPQLVHARTAELVSTQCPLVTVVAKELEVLRDFPHPSVDHAKDDDAGTLFVLETPGHPPIDLNRLDAGHQLVRWANRAWSRLAVCREPRSQLP